MRISSRIQNDTNTELMAFLSLYLKF